MSDRPAETEYSALQALLQIRTNNGEGGQGDAAGETGDSSPSGGGTNAASVPAPASVSPNATINRTNANANQIANLIRMGALQTARLGFPPPQLAAIRSPLQNANGFLQAAALQNPTLTALHPNPIIEAMARDPALAAAAAVATAPRSPALDVPRSPALSPLRPAPAAAGGSISPAGQSLDSATGKGEGQEAAAAAEKKIRKDEVEAALRSKPQRGRKRENLNAEERLELTRTRNREHAKSTRIRKKARYQELLDTEQKYLELKNLEGLEVKRRETVMGFLDARASMLRSTVNITLKPAAKQVSPESQKGDTEENRPSGGESRAISFDHAESLQNRASAEGETTPKAGLKTDDSAKSFKDYLESEDNFGFETSLGDIHAIDSSAMIRFDENVARRLEQMLGPSAASCPIKYRVLGGAGGIAMNKDDTGFARVEHYLDSTSTQSASASPDASANKDETLLLSSLVSFQFVKDSHLINSVAWSILKDAMGISGCDSVNGSKSDSTAKESLESQTVYPSVVSFDEAAKAKGKATVAVQPEQQSPMDQMDNNPGMSI